MDQMKEKAALDIKQTATKKEQQHIQNLHEKFMRTLDLKLQLDKLEKKFVTNMPPPSLNVFDKLELRAKGLKSDNVQLCSFLEQWRNILRKTKLDLTTLMRQAKAAEIQETSKEYKELLRGLSGPLRESYDAICYVSRIRHVSFQEEN